MKRFKILRNILLATIASSSLLNVAHADDALKMELTANQVIKNAEGKTVYTPVRTAPAGTVIQYKANYTNTINKDINDLMVTLPIPANMTFTGDAMPASAQASIDGKMVKIPYSEYRTLRWNIKLLPAKKSAAVALNTTVN